MDETSKPGDETKSDGAAPAPAEAPRVAERVVSISGVHSARRDFRERDLAVGRLRTRMQHVLDLARDAFVETDRHGSVTEWNRQSELGIETIGLTPFRRFVLAG